MSSLDEPRLPTASSLRQIVGALIFGSATELTAEAIRKCLQEVGAEAAPATEGTVETFAAVTARDIREAALDLQKDLERLELGFVLTEVNGGFRLQTQPACGRWVRSLLQRDRPNRLSRPALETLAIIAYRQPIAKSEIEGVRGVTVDHIIKALMELHLVRIVGRSDLPGRPFLYGTTASFLEHFGLKHLDELNEMDPTLQRAKPKQRAALHRIAKPVTSEEATEAPAEVVATPAEVPTDAPHADPEDGTDPMREVLGPATPPAGAEPVFDAPPAP